MAKKEKPRLQSTTVLVNEKGLTTGSGELADGSASNNSDPSEYFSGVLSADGAPGPYTYTLSGSGVGIYGTLTLNSATGAYSYTLLRTYDGPDANNGTNTSANRDSFTVTVTAANGETARSTISINIIDDVPIALADVATVPQALTATGNVVANDIFGADGPTAAGGGVVGVAAGVAAGSVSGGTGTAIAGMFGTLTLTANGNWSYQANASVPSGDPVDRFTYTIRDGDGDLSTTQLSVTVTGGTGNPFDVRLFGAKGDGVTNDQAAIQAAINAAHAAGGGVVEIPAGTYIVGPGGTDTSDGAIELLSNVTLQGAGMGLTVLNLANGVPNDINGFVRTPYGETTSNVQLLDLTLDGNRANNTAKVNAFLTGVAPGSTLAVEDVTVARVEARNFTGYGFDPHEQTIRLIIEDSVAHHNGLDGFVADFLTDSVFRNNVSYSNDRHGFNVVTSTSDFLMENNVAHDNAGTGITIQRGSDPTYAFTSNITVEGGAVYANGAVGIEVKLSDQVQLNGIDIHDNAKEGIRISGATNVSVTSNTIENNGLSATSGFYDAVLIGDQFDTFSGTTFLSGNVSVTGNVIVSDGLIRPAFGISEESTASALTSFTGNSIDGMKQADVFADGKLYDQSGAEIGGGGTFDVAFFGAKGDGVTDDTAAIQAAIDAAHAAGGGVVTIGAGTYRISGTSDKSDGGIRLLDNVTVQGAGMGVTILKVIDNNAWDITGVVRTPFDEVTHDVAMFDLTIDGNRANNTTKIDGFYTGVRPNDPRQDYNITIERVEIMDCSGYGFDPHEQTVNLRIADSVAHGNGLDGFVADFLIDSVYENNVAYDNDRHGFNITTSTDGLQVINSVAYDNGSAGIVIQRGSEDIPAPSNILIQGGSYYGNAREGIYIKIADDVTISGVEVYGNMRQGIRIDGSTGVLVDGVTVYNNSQEANGTYDEIRLTQYDDTAGPSGLVYDTTGVVVSNSTIYADGAIRSRYGVYESPPIEGVNAATGNTITGTLQGDTYFAPQLVDPAENQTATVGTAFAYAVPPSSFVDGDDGVFTLSARLSSGAPLPAWLGFDPLTGQFSGTPTGNATIEILVEARDADALKDQTTFQLVISGGASGVTVNGTTGDDSLTGGPGADSLFGLAGHDLLAGLGGGDVLDGGDGIDTATYAASAGGVFVSLADGIGGGGDADGDTLTAIENLTGSSHDDGLTGNAGANELRGGGGNDTLTGLAGADLLDGGAGADTMFGGDGDDLYVIDGAGDAITEFDNGGLGGVDTVRTTISLALGANLENLTLLGAASIDATGNSKANVLTGNTGDNVLDGGLGNDTMIGGLGNDTYVVNVTGDVVIENGGEGTDTVRSATSRTLEAAVENLTLIGAANINATGNALANVLNGNDGVNILTGQDGDDILNGGGANDTLRGGLGADVLDGGAGADRMEGGDGNDTYHVEDAGDLVVEFANGGLGGTDSVFSSVSMVLGANVENLTLTGANAINGTGIGSANVLIGNSAANILDGLAGNDTLQGGGGDDRLIGGAGSDMLDGGDGTDRAVFAGARATYSITTVNGSVQVRDNDTATDGNDGTDTLSGIEVLEFKGGETVNLLPPVVLDLDGDGIELVPLGESAAAFDFRGDGIRTATGWIGAGDALLFLDRDGNGTVSGAGELSFVGDLPGARSDLDGLRAFDSNGDDSLSALDEAFAAFRLWTDRNGDGVAEVDEISTLGQAGVAALSLGGSPTSQAWDAGENIVVNYASFTWADGSLGVSADVVLLHESLVSAGTDSLGLNL